MSGAAVTSFFMAVLWITLAATTAVVTTQSLENDEGREGAEVRAAIQATAWFVGILFALGYVVAGVGLTMDQPWGKAAAWIMMPWTLMLLPIGTGLGIYQMVVLPKHP